MPGLISLLSGFMSESVLGDSDGCCHLLLIKYERGWPRTKAFLSRMREFHSFVDKTRTLRFVKHSVEQNFTFSLRFCFIMDRLNGDESENERNEEFASEPESET